MNIQLKPELEQFIQVQIATGKFANIDDAINQAVKLLEPEQRLEELRRKLASGTEQIARGQVTDGEIVFAKLQDKIRNITE